MYPKSLNIPEFLISEVHEIQPAHGWFRQRATRCSHHSSAESLQCSADGWQAWVLPPHTFPSAPQNFLVFIWLFECALFMIFCYNVYKAFLYVFSSKANVKNAPPYLHCWTSVHVGCKCLTPTPVCVWSSFIPVWLCTPAEHSHTLTCQLTSIKKPSSEALRQLPKPRTASAWCGCGHGLRWTPDSRRGREATTAASS